MKAIIIIFFKLKSTVMLLILKHNHGFNHVSELFKFLLQVMDTHLMVLKLATRFGTTRFGSKNECFLPL